MAGPLAGDILVLSAMRGQTHNGFSIIAGIFQQRAGIDAVKPK